MNFCRLLTLTTLSLLCIKITWADPGQILSIQEKDVVLFQSPGSKQVVEKLEPGQNIVIILQQGGWVKVADIHNGNVGWISQGKLEANLINHKVHAYTVTEKGADGKIVKTYHVVEYNDSKALTDEQAQKMFERIHNQQLKIQEYIHKMIANSFRAFENF